MTPKGIATCPKMKANIATRATEHNVFAVANGYGNNDSDLYSRLIKPYIRPLKMTETELCYIHNIRFTFRFKVSTPRCHENVLTQLNLHNDIYESILNKRCVSVRFYKLSSLSIITLLASGNVNWLRSVIATHRLTWPS